MPLRFTSWYAHLPWYLTKGSFVMATSSSGGLSCQMAYNLPQLLACHPSPQAPEFQLSGACALTMSCRQGRGRVEFRSPESGDLKLSVSQAHTASVAMGLLDERSRRFERTGFLWDFCKDVTAPRSSLCACMRITGSHPSLMLHLLSWQGWGRVLVLVNADFVCLLFTWY